MLQRGIIPAYAGQIGKELKSRSLHKDHPRIRGTNFCKLFRPSVQLGSSPHTRDKSFNITGGFFMSRIIPAYAGQISKGSKLICNNKDHPRIRGTNNDSRPGYYSLLGSSPHTRDKLQAKYKDDFETRIIPAYAGQIIKFYCS